jgi:hypothetical protein
MGTWDRSPANVEGMAVEQRRRLLFIDDDVFDGHQ